jgi:zinc protease
MMSALPARRFVAAGAMLLLTSVAAAPTMAQQRAGNQPAPKATLVTTVEGISEYTLPNGLRVLLFPDQSKATATINITYLVGSRHEGYGEAGMAHLLEHLLFKGSTRHPNIPQELTERGSRPNGTTWYDRTNYFETVPATEDNIDWALDLEADRMVNSFVRKSDLESEYSVVRNEFESGENSPFAVTQQRLMSAAFDWHGYGRSTIGNRADIENVPIERLQAFYRRYYQPDNAVLVVAGRFDPARTLRVIEEKFGAIPRPDRSLDKGNLLYETYTMEPVQDGEREVTVRRVGDIQLLMIGHKVPAGSHPDFAAVSVLARVLGTNPSGRLYKSLVDTKLATRVGVGAFQLREPGILFAQAVVATDQSLANVRTAMERTLAEAAAGEFTEEEVERAKAGMARNVQLTLNNSEYIGYELTEWAAMGDWRLFFLNRDRVAAVTTEDVRRVAQAYMKPANRTVAQFIPTEGPDRAEIPAVTNIVAMVANYKGGTAVQEGEAFDPAPAHIESRLTRTKLANGMSVTLLPKQTRGGKVNVQLTLRFGTEEALQGRSSIASLAGGMLTRGTQSLTRQQVQDSLQKLKANVFVGGSATGASASIETTRENLLPALELALQQLRSPRMDEAEFETLKRERVSQLEQSKSEPSMLASRALQRKLVPYPKGHVLYTTTMDEAVEELNAVTLAQVREFHREFYGAADGDVAVIGDFDPQTLSAALAAGIGDWKSRQPYRRIARAFVPSDSTTEKIETPDKPNAVFLVGSNIEVNDSDPDYAALVLGNFMLGGGFLNSRLATRIRQQDGLSYGVGSGMSIPADDRTASFRANAIYAPQNVERLTAAFFDEIEKMLRSGFTAEEVDAAKRGWLLARTQSRANDEELVGLLISRRFYDRTLAWDADLEQKIQALTPESINAAMRKHIDPKRMVIIRAGDFVNNPPPKPVM